MPLNGSSSLKYALHAWLSQHLLLHFESRSEIGSHIESLIGCAGLVRLVVFNVEKDARAAVGIADEGSLLAHEANESRYWEA